MRNHVVDELNFNSFIRKYYKLYHESNVYSNACAINFFEATSGSESVCVLVSLKSARSHGAIVFGM